MSDMTEEVRALRETPILDPKTGQRLRKPTPPPMREGVRGALVYWEREAKTSPDLKPLGKDE